MFYGYFSIVTTYKQKIIYIMKTFLSATLLSAFMSIGTATAQNHFVAKTTKAGTLAEVIGDRINDIDSLVVEGPVNANDFITMCNSCNDGKLAVINLAKADVEHNKIPDFAFYRNNKINKRIRRVILPDGIEEIGASVFYMSSLETINLPNSLRKLGKGCFNGCGDLYFDILTIPEGITEVPDECFMFCTKLKGKTVQLPSTIKRIGANAFFSSMLAHVNFPEGLEEIGTGAFYSCNFEFTELILPEGLTKLGNSVFSFSETIGMLALPSTLVEIGARCFNDLYKLKRIYSAAPVPPACDESKEGPFGGGTPSYTPVYVPKGSMRLYREAHGWDYFRTYIETDDFPTGISTVGIHEGNVKVSGADGMIVIVTDLPRQDFTVYSTDGRTVADGTVDGQRTEIPVAAGAYIVKAGGSTAKVAVR